MKMQWTKGTTSEGDECWTTSRLVPTAQGETGEVSLMPQVVARIQRGDHWCYRAAALRNGKLKWATTLLQSWSAATRWVENNLPTQTKRAIAMELLEAGIC